jgi:hypothetical protein
MRLGEQLAQIFITRAILHQHWQDSSIFHGQLATDDGAHPIFPRCHGKALRSVNAIAIEQGDCRHLQFGGGNGQMLRPGAAAQKTECAAGMQLDVRHGIGEALHRYIVKALKR